VFDLTKIPGAGSNTGQTLDVWCLDLLNLLQAGPYTYQISPLTTAGAGGSNPTLTSLQITEIGDLMLNGANGSNPDRFAAAQLAIWAVEYGVAFSTSGVGATLAALEATDIANVRPGGAWYNTNVQVNLLHDAVTAPNQTLGFAVTPLPATLPLFASSLGALGLLGWRRKRKALSA
jgi:hypothetical protein